MTFSTRISIKWLNGAATELTKTYVLTSPKNAHFVDLRPYLKPLPTSSQNKFPFEFAAAGREECLEENKILFHHEINCTQLLSGKSNNPPPDLGHFKQLPSGDRLESGEMENLASGKIERYEEIWRSLDPIKSCPKIEYREEAGCSVSGYVLEINDEKFHGKMIRMGNWIQGILWSKNVSLIKSLNIVRAYHNGKDWQILVEHGEKANFPLVFNKDSDDDSILCNGVEWQCIEKYP